MDANAPATPSFKLAMAPTWDAHHPSSLGSSSSMHMHDDLLHCDGARTSPDLLYEQLCTMIGQEERDGYKCCDYLGYYASLPPAEEKPRAGKSIDEGCRTSICGWMYRVSDHFALDREVVSIALSYIDRILSTNYCADRRTFKLISATSLHLAIKVHYPHRWQEVGSLLPDLSRGDFALDDLIGMEKELVHSLTWLMNPATAQGIALHILSLLPPGPSRTALNSIASMALFFAELSVCDYYFVTSRKSVLAIAAVLNASESTGFVPFGYHRSAYDSAYQNDWHMHIEKLLSDIGYVADWHEVSSARERLWSLYRQSSDEEHSTVPAHEVQSPVPPRKPDYDHEPMHFLQDYPSPTTCIDHRL